MDDQDKFSDKEKFDPEETKIVWIAVRNLAVIWDTAQRKYRPHYTKKIMAEFDPYKFKPVKVMAPNCNGVHHICDGQHGVAAVREMWGENQKVPCLVDPNADIVRAADIFLDHNNDNPIAKIDKFKIGVTAKRREEVAINRIVHHCGYHVDNTHAQNSIGAVDALRFVYHKGAKILDRVLLTLRETWGGEAAAVCAPILRGYGVFVCEFAEAIDWQRLAEVVARKWTPGRFVIDIKLRKEALHITNTEAARHLLLQVYNLNLGEKKKLKRKQSD